MRSVLRFVRRAAAALLCVLSAFFANAAAAANGPDLPEYRLKAAFVYNFALFTEWPSEVGNTLNVCVFGKDPFGDEIDPLQGKPVGTRAIAVHRRATLDSLKGCHLVFIAGPAMQELPKVLEALRGAPVLTVADTPGAVNQGVALNMNLVRNKVTFEANLEAARAARLILSSKLLKLATEVRQ